MTNQRPANPRFVHSRKLVFPLDEIMKSFEVVLDLGLSHYYTEIPSYEMLEMFATLWTTLRWKYYYQSRQACANF